MLISFAFYINRRLIYADISLALGLMVSPFIVLGTPFFLLNYNHDKELYKPALIMCISCIIVYLGVNIKAYQETISGVWSLCSSLKNFIRAANIPRGLFMIVYGLTRSFHIMLLVLIMGLMTIFKNNKRLFWISALVFLLHVPTSFTEYRQGAYFFGFYPFLALLLANGLNQFMDIYKPLTTSLLVIYGIINLLFFIYPERKHIQSVIQTYKQLEGNDAIVDSTMVFLYPSRRFFRYYIKRLSAETVGDYGSPNGKIADYSNVTSIKTDMFLIESGSRQPDDTIKGIFSFLSKRFKATDNQFGFLSFPGYLKAGNLNCYPNIR